VNDADRDHMAAALVLAERGLGQVWPNPAVGAILVNEGRVVGRGWTQPGGRPHAETEALGRAGGSARGATIYVTLEPCAHVGKTPPCADALAAAGIGRAVVAVQDPDPRVSGKGLQRMAGAGIAIDLGLLGVEARDLNAGFFSRVLRGRPTVTVKCATTLDGRIATRTGESRWITGEEARRAAHGLRASHDAVMIGIGTAIADDPDLTCRLPGMEHRSPVRIVVDGRLQLPLTGTLARTASRSPVWLVTLAGGEGHRRRALIDLGVDLIEVSADRDGRPNLAEALNALGSRGLTRVLAEGGSALTGALLASDLVDRIVWYRASVVVGGDGVPVAAPLGIDRLRDGRRFRLIHSAPVGTDIAETYVPER
jgi:diaminohydroxyphosphoribosylaminopyrimidine deaminase/5-amino-6-(5-phosphoribosylamino)uracil reductase